MNLWSDPPWVSPSQDQPCLSSPLSGNVTFALSLVVTSPTSPHLLPKTVRNSWNLNWNFHLKESSKGYQVILSCLVIAILGYSDWTLYLLILVVLLATSWKKWVPTMCFFFTRHPTLPGFHGNIWKNPIKKIFFIPFLLPFCSPDVPTHPGLWLAARASFFLFIELLSVLCVPSGPDPGFT